MGGFGSGGYHGCKQATMEDHLTTNIGLIAKWGYLNEGATGTLRWTCGGDLVGSVSVVGGVNMLVFSYTQADWDGEKERIKHHIHIERTTLEWVDWFNNQRLLKSIGAKDFSCNFVPAPESMILPPKTGF